jgi:hypothetical protein
MEANGSANDTFEDTSTASWDVEMPTPSVLNRPIASSGVDQGPCLYLGPSGQRCDRRALEGGYCSSHRPGATSLPKVTASKRTLAAIAAIAGLLWPVIADVVREIMRWMHSH